MDYNFLKENFDINSENFPESGEIDKILLQNNKDKIIAGLKFLESKEKLLHVHGFLGTGKKQFVNYISEFTEKNVIKLEYYCKEATVCDDILLDFTEKIEKFSISKAVNLNTKILSFLAKLKQQISSIKKPFLIILHTADDISKNNAQYIENFVKEFLKEENVKFIITTSGLSIGKLESETKVEKIFLNALSIELFKDLINDSGIKTNPKSLEDFYNLSRGYYYYTKLSIKIMQAMNLTLDEFIQKCNLSGVNFDEFLNLTYINLVPANIRNFFWFLRMIRHGISINALAVFDIYDEFSIEYLKTNLILFQADDMIYMHDYFYKNSTDAIPLKTQIRLHKYIASIYEKQLKESPQNRVIFLSRQSFREEIEYHNKQIKILLGEDDEDNKLNTNTHQEQINQLSESVQDNKQETNNELKKAEELTQEKKYTDAIEIYLKSLELGTYDSQMVNNIRLSLARVYKEICDYKSAAHYYELVETYYKQNNEQIRQSYLYNEMTDLYYKMYKHERAIEYAKKVIYSLDTPQTLLVQACMLIGNIYSDIGKNEEAYSYYQKAIDSSSNEESEKVLSELYFKFGLANDEKDNVETALNYYSKCISLNNSPYKALAYSNMASCYYDNGNHTDALSCYQQAYEIEKSNNNYEGIYYNSLRIAKILENLDSEKALDFYIEAKKSAEFINEGFYILESALAIGDFYYKFPDKLEDCLKEYFKAKKAALELSEDIEINKIDKRINDMKLRLSKEDFNRIEEKYGI